jgi:hypothetical protein
MQVSVTAGDLLDEMDDVPTEHGLLDPHERFGEHKPVRSGEEVAYVTRGRRRGALSDWRARWRRRAVEEGYRDLQNVRDVLEAARADPISALVVFLHFQNRPAPVDTGRARYNDDVRLLASLPYLMNLDTTHRGRVAVFQFVRRERGDNSFLIGSDQVRECTGFEMKHDNLLRLVDGIRSVVRHRFWNQAGAFFGIRLVRVNGRDLRIVGTRDEDKKPTIRVEDVDTRRIGAKLFQLAAIRTHLIR